MKTPLIIQRVLAMTGIWKGNLKTPSAVFCGPAPSRPCLGWSADRDITMDDGEFIGNLQRSFCIGEGEARRVIEAKGLDFDTYWYGGGDPKVTLDLAWDILELRGVELPEYRSEYPLSVYMLHGCEWCWDVHVHEGRVFPSLQVDCLGMPSHMCSQHPELWSSIAKERLHCQAQVFKCPIHDCGGTASKNAAAGTGGPGSHRQHDTAVKCDKCGRLWHGVASVTADGTIFIDWKQVEVGGGEELYDQVPWGLKSMYAQLKAQRAAKGETQE